MTVGACMHFQKETKFFSWVYNNCHQQKQLVQCPLAVPAPWQPQKKYHTRTSLSSFTGFLVSWWSFLESNRSVIVREDSTIHQQPVCWCQTSKSWVCHTEECTAAHPAPNQEKKRRGQNFTCKAPRFNIGRFVLQTVAKLCKQSKKKNKSQNTLLAMVWDIDVTNIAYNILIEICAKLTSTRKLASLQAMDNNYRHSWTKWQRVGKTKRQQTTKHHPAKPQDLVPIGPVCLHFYLLWFKLSLILCSAFNLQQSARHSWSSVKQSSMFDLIWKVWFKCLAMEREATAVRWQSFLLWQSPLVHLWYQDWVTLTVRVHKVRDAWTCRACWPVCACCLGHVHQWAAPFFCPRAFLSHLWWRQHKQKVHDNDCHNFSRKDAQRSEGRDLACASDMVA